MKKLVLTMGLLAALGITASAANSTDGSLQTEILGYELSGWADMGDFMDKTAYVCMYKDGILTDVQIPEIDGEGNFTADLTGVDDADKLAVYLWAEGTMVPMGENIYDFSAIDRSITGSAYSGTRHDTLFVTAVEQPEGNDDVLLRITGVDWRGMSVSYDITTVTGIWEPAGEQLFSGREYNVRLINDPVSGNDIDPAELISAGDVISVDGIGSRALTVFLVADTSGMNATAENLFGWDKNMYHCFSNNTREGWTYGAVRDCYIENDEAVFTVGSTVWSDDKDRRLPAAELEFSDDGTLLSCNVTQLLYNELDPPESAEDRSYDVIMLYTHKGVVYSAAVYRLTNAPADYVPPEVYAPGDYGSYGIIINGQSSGEGINVKMFDIATNTVKELTMAAGAQYWPGNETAARAATAADLAAICDRSAFEEYRSGNPLTLCRYREDGGAIFELYLAGGEGSAAAVRFDYDSYAGMTAPYILSSRYFIGSDITEAWAPEDMTAAYAQEEDYYSAAPANGDDYLVLEQTNAICFVDYDSRTKKPALMLRFEGDRNIPDTSVSDAGWTAEGHPAVMVTEVGADFVTGLLNGASVTYTTRTTSSLYQLTGAYMFGNRVYNAEMVWNGSAEDKMGDYIAAGDVLMVDAENGVINSSLKIADGNEIGAGNMPAWANGKMQSHNISSRDVWIGGTVSAVQHEDGQTLVTIGEEIIPLDDSSSISVSSGGALEEGAAGDIEAGDLAFIKLFRYSVQNVFVYK